MDEITGKEAKALLDYREDVAGGLMNPRFARLRQEETVNQAITYLDGPYLETGIMAMLRKRAGSLIILFLGEMLTATAMSCFEQQIEQAVVLALFIPLLISSDGNSGSQATTLIIRAMALGELRLKDWWRVIAANSYQDWP